MRQWRVVEFGAQHPPLGEVLVHQAYEPVVMAAFEQVHEWVSWHEINHKRVK